jgi:predicted O-linked N-acetylglucosamine transferase (SPINDLY family)
MTTALDQPPARAFARDRRAEAAYRRGLDLAERQRWRQAADAFREALARQADDAVFWLNLAHAQVRIGELEDAARSARRALAIDPDSALAVSIATQCLAACNHPAEIVSLLEAMPEGRQHDAGTLFSLGEAYTALQQYPQAVDSYLAALARKPDFVPAHVHLGNVFERLKLHTEARECFLTGMALGGNAGELASAVIYQTLHACRWEVLEKDLAALRTALATPGARAAPFQLLTLPSSRSEQRAAAAAHWQDRCGSVVPLSPPAPRRAGSALRIGYLSNDIFQHATAYLVVGLLEQHDRSRHEVFLYSYGLDDNSAIRSRIVDGAGKGFVDARHWSDRALAERIRADDIDILVDLKGYTLGSRLQVPALRPARLNVNFLGYPGTLGTDVYDYIIGDPVVTPLDHAADFAERIAQMPHCYQPNDRARPVAPTPSRRDCGIPEGAFVFASFNNSYKITPCVFDIWCRLLLAVPASVFWLYEGNPQARANLSRGAQERGVDPRRLLWAPHVPQAEHLGRLGLADLALDTWPVNAHTTASDALWAGVPMITLTGDTFVSRVAASVLRAGGLPELVAADARSYETLALALAREPTRLVALRQRMAGLRLSCPLFDSAAHTRDLESLYARMMARREQGLAPEHLPARLRIPPGIDADTRATHRGAAGSRA